MKKVYNFLVLFFFTCLTTGVVYAEPTDEEISSGQVTLEKITELLAQGNGKDAVTDYLYFDGTTLWMLIAAFGIAIGMINLSADVAKHFASGAGDRSVGNMAYQGVTALAGGTAIAVTKGVRAAKGIHEQSKEEKKVDAQRSAGNRTYDRNDFQNNNADRQNQQQGNDDSKTSNEKRADSDNNQGNQNQQNNQGEGGPTNDQHQNDNKQNNQSNNKQGEGGPTNDQRQNDNNQNNQNNQSNNNEGNGGPDNSENNDTNDNQGGDSSS